MTAEGEPLEVPDTRFDEVIASAGVSNTKLMKACLARIVKAAPLATKEDLVIQAREIANIFRYFNGMKK